MNSFFPLLLGDVVLLVFPSFIFYCMLSAGSSPLYINITCASFWNQQYKPLYTTSSFWQEELPEKFICHLLFLTSHLFFNLLQSGFCCYYLKSHTKCTGDFQITKLDTLVFHLIDLSYIWHCWPLIASWNSFFQVFGQHPFSGRESLCSGTGSSSYLYVDIPKVLPWA